VLPRSITDGLVSAEDTALGIVALYLGLEMLAHLDDDQTSRAESLLVSAHRVVGLIAGTSSTFGGPP
jgi:hypothetical protein